MIAVARYRAEIGLVVQFYLVSLIVFCDHKFTKLAVTKQADIKVKAICHYYRAFFHIVHDSRTFGQRKMFFKKAEICNNNLTWCKPCSPKKLSGKFIL